jgi:hypothetical protein
MNIHSKGLVAYTEKNCQGVFSAFFNPPKMIYPVQAGQGFEFKRYPCRHRANDGFQVDYQK